MKSTCDINSQERKPLPPTTHHNVNVFGNLLINTDFYDFPGDSVISRRLCFIQFLMFTDGQNKQELSSSLAWVK